MIKFFIKCAIVLLALQSAMDFLRKEDIIEGSIKVNYQAVQQKVVAAIPAEEIAAGILKFATNKIKEVVTKDDATPFRISFDQKKEKKSRFKIVSHVVGNGETLGNLSRRYGIHWRVIQRVNHLDTGQKLFIGQKLKIPSKMHQLI